MRTQDDAGSVIRVLDLYKVDNGLTPSAKKAQAKDAKTVAKKSRTVVDTDEAGSTSRNQLSLR